MAGMFGFGRRGRKLYTNETEMGQMTSHDWTNYRGLRAVFAEERGQREAM